MGMVRFGQAESIYKHSLWISADEYQYHPVSFIKNFLLHIR